MLAFRFVRLAMAASEANMSHHQVVSDYGSFVRSIARKVKKSVSARIELDDLISYGMTGLLEAADRFDPKHGANFTTFSYYRVRGAIYDGLRKMGWVSRAEYSKIKFNQQANSYLESNINNPSDNLEDLAEQVNNLVTIFVTSLEGLEYQEFSNGEKSAQEDRLLELEIKENLKKALKKLPRADLDLIQLYYFNNLSLEEVGKKIGLSKSWTCRKHAQVVSKLSSIMKGLV